MATKEHVERIKQLVMDEFRADLVAAKLGGNYAALRELKSRRSTRYMQYVVEDARQRGITDAEYNPKRWGLISPGAHNEPRDLTNMPRCVHGWPLVWQVAEDWGVSAGCGNWFNHEVDVDQAFEERERT